MTQRTRMEPFEKKTKFIFFSFKARQGIEEFCYVTLVSNNEKRFPAQKVVPAPAHTLFRDLFQSDKEEDDYQVIHIKGAKSSFMTAG